MPFVLFTLFAIASYSSPSPFSSGNNTYLAVGTCKSLVRAIDVVETARGHCQSYRVTNMSAAALLAEYAKVGSDALYSVNLSGPASGITGGLHGRSTVEIHRRRYSRKGAL